ncbi:hypothetical protein L6164_010429 [Bauhinia variegata]|uniref:Uncharacterized protein n=1 Tax=Bauhinia variegata TaxID=167791 RepID=A0ACB9PN30_BAUVA|nr:hypothetical protein L6164_010429 [Bauhinia variegata]
MELKFEAYFPAPTSHLFFGALIIAIGIRQRPTSFALHPQPLVLIEHQYLLIYFKKITTSSPCSAKRQTRARHALTNSFCCHRSGPSAHRVPPRNNGLRVFTRSPVDHRYVERFYAYGVGLVVFKLAQSNPDQIPFM